MKKIMFAFLLLVGLNACRGFEQWPPQPASIQLGETVCSECKMIISDDRYGAQLFERGKQVELFDDYGCLLKRSGLSSPDQRVIYARSFEDASWLRAEQAFFVVSKNISSPMGYGIAAFAAKNAAATFAKGVEQSKVYSFSELLPAAEKLVRAGSPMKE